MTAVTITPGLAKLQPMVVTPDGPGRLLWVSPRADHPWVKVRLSSGRHGCYRAEDVDVVVGP